jgi:hypothetical protein|nr:MAG TPA: hypothetical protein [Caudoviricetes sp.]
MINLNDNQNYYIHRISKKYKEDFERDYGLSLFLSLDYMGSAEYEFGAVGDSIKFLRENVNDYVLKVGKFKLNISGKEEVTKLFMFVPKGTDDEYIPNLFKNIYDYKHRTKEGTYIQDIGDLDNKAGWPVTCAWFNLRVNGYASEEIPWFVSTDPMIAWYFYKLIMVDSNMDKEQKQIFDSISIGQKVTYPYHDGKQFIFEEGTVAGFNEDSITVKRFNKKLRFHWRQVIFK